MAILRYKPMTALLAAGAMLVSSTGAVASTPARAPQISSWAALSALSGGAPAAALAGSAATVAQAGPDEGPPPPTPVPPVEPPGEGLGLGVSPLLLALGAIGIGAAAYFLLKKHHKHATSPA